MTEQFEIPKTIEEFEALKTASVATLRGLGLRCWDKEVNLWLFPGAWYEHIPNGLEVTDIFDEVETFQRGVSDDDTRYGCLPYGVVVKNEETEGAGRCEPGVRGSEDCPS